METATRKGVVDGKPDLIAIEADYRAGVLSLRAIGTKHGITEGAVRKWAKAANPPWQRDLTAVVHKAARTQLMRDSVRGTHHAYDGVRTATEKELVEVAARSIVQVVREHRGAIQAGQQMVGMLLGQLQDCATHRERLEELILEDTADADGTGKAAEGAGRRRTAMMRAVSLPQHAATMKDLAIAMKHLVGLERQAFGLADVTDPTPKEPVAAPVVTDGDFAELRQKFADRMGVVIDVQSRQPAAAT